MKRIFLFMVVLAVALTSCDNNSVKIRGKVLGLNGTVKLMAEKPGQQGLALLAQQDVVDGEIDLSTEELQIPARVWIDIAGMVTLETVVDSKDQIWIKGKAKFADQIEVQGSGLDVEYEKLKKRFKEKYESPLEPIDRNIQKIMNKKKQSKDDDVMLGVFQLQRLRYIKARANYVKNLIEANPKQELSLILLQDELRDSLDLQKRLFKAIQVANKESNLYKVVEDRLK